MGITQTNIPFAYGYCGIKLINTDGTSPDTTYGNGYIFAIDTNDFPDIEEVKYEATTIHNVRKKHTDKIHLSFTLRLREDSTLTSASGYCDADAILRFLHFYPRQTTEDKAIVITPARCDTGSNNISIVGDVNSWFVLVDSIRVENVVSGTRGKGQQLVLQCKTKYPIRTSDWTMFFRNTSNDNFYIGAFATTGVQKILVEVEDDNIYFSS